MSFGRGLPDDVGAEASFGASDLVDGRTEAESQFSRELLAKVFNGEGVAGVAAALHRRTRMPVVVADSIGRVIADPGWQELALPFASSVPLGAQFPTAEHGVVLPFDGGYMTFVRPAGDIVALLAVSDTAAMTGEPELRALQSACVAVTMVMVRERGVVEAELASRGDLVTEVLEGDMVRAQSHARMLGQDLSRAHRAAVIVPRAESELLSLEAALRRMAPHFGIHSPLLALREGVLVLLTPVELNFAQLAVLLGDECRTSVDIGVGLRRSADELARSYREARLALGLARRLGWRRHVVAFEQLGVWGVLAANADGESLRDLTREFIGPLVAYDNEHGMELLKTLGVYLSASGMDEAASELSVHRNTLKYRLQKIAAVTGCDLSDPDDRFQMELAFRAHMVVVTMST